MWWGKNGPVIRPAAGRVWAMTTYVYETIPQREGEAAERFEVRQGMNDAKLTEQPGTGKPVRRLVSGGFALLRGETGPSVGSVTDASWNSRG